MSRRKSKRKQFLVFKVRYWKSWDDPNMIIGVPVKIYRKSVTKGTDWKAHAWLKNLIGGEE